MAGEPVDVASIAKTLDLPAAMVEQGLADLAESISDGSELRLQVHNGKYQLVTAPAAAPLWKVLNLDFSTKLSSAALETLAVVAYRQPVTRAQIEAVRGVDCAAVLRSLMQRGLIEETGRLEAAGRPILYGVTDLFMQHFGLMELGELPPLAHEDEDLHRRRRWLRQTPGCRRVRPKWSRSPQGTYTKPPPAINRPADRRP